METTNFEFRVSDGGLPPFNLPFPRTESRPKGQNGTPSGTISAPMFFPVPAIVQVL